MSGSNFRKEPETGQRELVFYKRKLASYHEVSKAPAKDFKSTGSLTVLSVNVYLPFFFF